MKQPSSITTVAKEVAAVRDGSVVAERGAQPAASGHSAHPFGTASPFLAEGSAGGSSAHNLRFYQ